jgi:hypothetical protein
MVKNARLARATIALVAERIPVEHACIASRALAGAIMTDRAAIPAATAKRLDALIGKYLR